MSEQLTEIEQLLFNADSRVLEAIKIFETVMPLYEETMRIYRKSIEVPIRILTTDKTSNVNLRHS